jgi:hypothetical protein
MSTRYVGLTPAMRRCLDDLRAGHVSSNAMYLKAVDAGFVREELSERTPLSKRITPRGHAALAAPRMTQAELDMLCGIDVNPCFSCYGHEWAMAHKFSRAGWIEQWTIGDIPGGEALIYLTPAGRIALNNVRAAIGSPDYKENMT